MKGFIEAVVLIIAAVAVALVMGQQSGDNSCSLSSNMTTRLTYSAVCACANGLCNQTSPATSFGYCAEQIFGNTSCIEDLVINTNMTCGNTDVPSCCSATYQNNLMPYMATFFDCYSNQTCICSNKANGTTCPQS